MKEGSWKEGLLNFIKDYKPQLYTRNMVSTDIKVGDKTLREANILRKEKIFQKYYTGIMRDFLFQ